MFVCLSAGMWRTGGHPNPCPRRDKILRPRPRLSEEGFGVDLTQAPHLPGPGGPETLKAEGRPFENCLQNKKVLSRSQIIPGSVGYRSYSMK